MNRKSRFTPVLAVLLALTAAAPADEPAGFDRKTWSEIADHLRFARVPLQWSPPTPAVQGIVQFANSSNVDIFRREREALKAFNKGKRGRAKRHYEVLAAYGLKSAQFMLGVMQLEGSGGLEQDAARGLAWMWLATENGSLDDKARSFIVNVWRYLDEPGRERARDELKTLLPYYSNFGLLERTREYAHKQLVNMPGSRMPTANPQTTRTFSNQFGGDGESGGAAGLRWASLQAQYWAIEQKLAEAGEVELGELELVDEPADRHNAPDD